MTAPTLADCILEADLSCSVRLYDASHLMPRRKGTLRDVAGIDRLFFHHSGALGRSGFAGALASARYVVTRRRFPGPAYTFWLPAEYLRDADGKACVLRLNADEVRSWHTGAKANGRGVAACFQGNTTAKPLTASHVECAEALLPWAIERYSLPVPEGISRHSDAKKDGARKNKRGCPGKSAEAWLDVALSSA